jgi:hypothetical protein
MAEGSFFLHHSLVVLFEQMSVMWKHVKQPITWQPSYAWAHAAKGTHRSIPEREEVGEWGTSPLLPTEVEADELELVRPLTCSPSSLVALRASMPARPQATGR